MKNTSLTVPLSMLECKPCILYLQARVEHAGLMRILHDFLTTAADRVRDTVASWYDALVSGQPMQDALADAQPPWPDCLRSVLLAAVSHSRLDAALRDLAYLYQKQPEERALQSACRRLADTYSRQPRPKGLSAACLERELGKILARACLEQAFAVYLGQQGDAFFRQTYLGAKPVHYTEPSEPVVLTDIRRHLTALADTGQPLELAEGAWRVAARGRDSFILCQGARRLQLTIHKAYSNPDSPG